MSQPWLVSGVEKPNPGIDGATTWNAGAGPTPEVDPGRSASVGAMPANSTKRRRVAVDEQQRHGRVVLGAHVQPVDRLAVDLGEELRQAIEPRLLRPPVVARAPVLRQSLGVGHGRAALPAVGERRGPSRALEA